MSFLGEYEHTIDTKQRLAIPSEIRAELDPETHGRRLVLAPGANGNLWIWPEKTFQTMAEGALDDSLLSDEEMLEFRQEVFSQSAKRPLDKAGRVRIPEAMLEEYSLKTTVMVLGVGDHLEVVDGQEWKRIRDERKARKGDIWRRAQSRRRENEAKGIGPRQDGS